MRPCFQIAAIGLFFVFGSLYAEEQKTPAASRQFGGDARDTVLVLDKQFWAAASDHDVETLGKLFAEDYLGIGADGHRWTRSSILEHHRSFRTGNLKLLNEREAIRVSEDAIMLTYDGTFEVYTRDNQLVAGVRQRLLSCWVQRNGGWFVRLALVTDLPAPEAVTPNAAGTKAPEKVPVVRDVEEKLRIFQLFDGVSRT